MTHVYADYAAQAPLRPEARRALTRALGAYGNPSSIHSAGRAGRRALESARRRVAALFGAATEEIIFTSSGSESVALALFGVARSYCKAHGPGHIIVSSVEHKAVLSTAKLLKHEGWRITEVPVDQNGRISPEYVMAALEKDTVLVSVMAVQNELGTLQPVVDIARALVPYKHDGYPYFHTDACQAAYFDLSPVRNGIDLMTINATKVGGPAGIALLYAQSGVPLVPLIPGEQELARRGGTENPALVLSFATALEAAVRTREKEYKRLNALTEKLARLLVARVPGLTINGHPTERSPHILHVTVPTVEGEAMLLMLDRAGIAVSTGSACSASDLRPSHVLTAIGQDPTRMHGSVRFSFGHATRASDIATLAKIFPQVVESLQALSVLTVQYALV